MMFPPSAFLMCSVSVLTTHDKVTTGLEYLLMYGGLRRRRDAAIATRKTSPERVTKKMTTQHMIVGFNVHEVPDKGDTGENNPKRKSS